MYVLYVCEKELLTKPFKLHHFCHLILVTSRYLYEYIHISSLRFTLIFKYFSWIINFDIERRETLTSLFLSSCFSHDFICKQVSRITGYNLKKLFLWWLWKCVLLLFLQNDPCYTTEMYRTSQYKLPLFLVEREEAKHKKNKKTHTI